VDVQLCEVPGETGVKEEGALRDTRTGRSRKDGHAPSRKRLPKMGFDAKKQVIIWSLAHYLGITAKYTLRKYTLASTY